MAELKLKEIINFNDTGFVEGKKLQTILEDYLSKNISAEIDLEGVRFLSSSFFNGAIGELVLKYPIDYLRNNLHFINISNGDKHLLSKSISLAKKFKENKIQLK
ncbi:MAG: STAS-like domain-containing protein [Nitrospirae bacterium]|nr:STAS-like domain-containing protein [Nitrospirota bacterium]MBF0541872.1 STAS-like domain-containing protein [Nitrospirota bacterium]